MGIGTVSRCKYAGYARRCPVFRIGAGNNCSLISLNLICKNSGIRNMTNGHENTVYAYFLFFSVLVFYLYSGNSLQITAKNV